MQGNRFEAAWRLALLGLFGSPLLDHVAEVVGDRAFQDRFIRIVRRVWTSAASDYLDGGRRRRAPRHHTRDILLTYWVLRGKSYFTAGRLWGAAMRLRDDERMAPKEWDAILLKRGSLDDTDSSPEAREFRSTAGNIHLVRALRREGEHDDATLLKQVVQEQIERLVAKAFAIAYDEVATWSGLQRREMLLRLRAVEDPRTPTERRNRALSDLSAWI